MKRLPWIVFTLLLSVPAEGQRNADYGIFAGVSSYIGDINPGRVLYSPLPAGGIFYRYNLHPRHSLRGSFFIGGITGSDLDFSNDFQINRAGSFSGSTAELSAQFEFNFLPYTTQGRLWDFTPYFSSGAGIAVVNTVSISYQPVIPIIFGFKANVYKNIGLEAEYGIRKTFYDNFDGLNDPVAEADKAWIHNNDWYSFAGISLTWKIYNKLAGCPAYSDVDGKKRK